jgi:cellulose synthase/poly-beta-1,6-N-acetylglucosamine synthase-like glycosyltransferase
MYNPLTIYFALIFLFGVLYFIIIFSYTIGWFKLKSFKLTNTDFKTTLSVIIPARNEEENILKILNDLKKQKYSSGLFEVIIIDDHSTDNTYNRVTDYIEKNSVPAFKIIGRIQMAFQTHTRKMQ